MTGKNLYIPGICKHSSMSAKMSEILTMLSLSVSSTLAQVNGDGSSSSPGIAHSILIPNALRFREQFTERPWIFECTEILVPRREVDQLPVFESSCWQIGIAEA
jgi:hypothetical protein